MLVNLLITRMITDRIGLHSVLLSLLISNFFLILVNLGWLFLYEMMLLERFQNKNVQLLSSLQMLFLLDYVNFAIVTYTLVGQSEICLFCPHPCLLRCEIEKFFLEHDGIFAYVLWSKSHSSRHQTKRQPPTITRIRLPKRYALLPRRVYQAHVDNGWSCRAGFFITASSLTPYILFSIFVYLHFFSHTAALEAVIFDYF